MDLLEITDPLGNRVYLAPSFCRSLEEQLHVDGQQTAKDVLTRPGLVVETAGGPLTIRHYFRAVNWEQSVLITVEPREAGWMATDCIPNPSQQQLMNLLRSGKTLLS